MNAIAFDTHAFIKRLTSVGMPEAQAEVLADEQTKLIESNLATKADLAKVETSLKVEIERVETSLKVEIERVETSLKSDIEIFKRDLTIRLGGMIMALGGVLIAIKFLEK